jgi:hypothetical protein
MTSENPSPGRRSSTSNNESLALTVSGEAANPDEARDIFAFAIGQLIGRELGRRGHGAPDPGVCLPARPDRGSAPGGAGRSRAGAEKGAVRRSRKHRTTRGRRTRRRSRTQCPRHHPLRRSKRRRPSHSASNGCATGDCTTDLGGAGPCATVTAPPEGFSLCAECGEAVPANQAKLSQLFQGKTLCKQCMEVP